jgi:hypothetical protein
MYQRNYHHKYKYAWYNLALYKLEQLLHLDSRVLLHQRMHQRNYRHKYKYAWYNLALYKLEQLLLLYTHNYGSAKFQLRHFRYNANNYLLG